MKLRRLLLGRKALTNIDSILKSRDITLPTKAHLVKAMVFPVVMYGCESLDHKEGWVPKSWCFWTVVLEKTLESPLDCKEIQPVHPKGNQFWIFIGRADAEAEAPVLWPPEVKSWLIRKPSDAGKNWRQEKGRTEDEMVGWPHRLNGHEFEQAWEDCEGQGSLACCSPWGHKELDMIEWLNNNNNTINSYFVCVCVCVCVGAQSCPTLFDPINCSPWGSSVHGIFPGKNTGVGCHFPLQGIFLTPESDQSLLCLLHAQAESLPLVPSVKSHHYLYKWENWNNHIIMLIYLSATENINEYLPGYYLNCLKIETAWYS